MRVLYFGTYDRAYPRNAQVISCLRTAGVEVVEHHASVWEPQRDSWRAGAGAVGRVAAGEVRLLRPAPPFDVMIVGYPGHFDLPLARRKAGRRPLVFSPLVSLADTFVDDRRRFRAGSIAARVLHAVDRRAFRLADVVVADTAAHAAFFVERIGVAPSRVEVCLVGAEERLFKPVWRRTEPFVALFVGKLIPLHGLETILAAARLAPEIAFRIVGSGQLQGLLESRPANVDWIPWVQYERLPDELGRAGCALGIFGTSGKAHRVIPNKAYQALACGTPLVTGDTPAARELLADGESALLVRPGDPDALAAAVRRIAASSAVAERLSKGGLSTFGERASERVLGSRWRAVVEAAAAARRAA